MSKRLSVQTLEESKSLSQKFTSNVSEDNSSEAEEVDIALGIIGCRGTQNTRHIERCISNFVKSLSHQGKNVTKIVSGGDGEGVDGCAEKYALRNSIAFQPIHADWAQKKINGPMKNKILVEQIDELLAFPSKKGKGTQQAIDKARRAGLPVHIFDLSDFEDLPSSKSSRIPLRSGEKQRISSIQ